MTDGRYSSGAIGARAALDIMPEAATAADEAIAAAVCFQFEQPMRQRSRAPREHARRCRYRREAVGRDDAPWRESAVAPKRTARVRDLSRRSPQQQLFLRSLIERLEETALA